MAYFPAMTTMETTYEAERVVEMCRLMHMMLTFNRGRASYRNPLMRAIEEGGEEALERLEDIEHVAKQTPS